MSTDFIVAQRLAGANMSVDVSVGTAYVLNSSWSANSNTHTKYWSVINDATVNAVIGANASGNPRIDIITLKVDTAATPDGNASNVGSIYVTAGTPAASPVAPATPSNHLLLAYVAVANGAVSIVTANITDKRVSVYLDTNPTATGLADLGMSRQAIMNGNFDIWQRGTSVAISDATDIYQADRWKDYTTKDGGTLPTLTRSRQLQTSGDVTGSYYFSRLATNGAGTSLGAGSIHFLQEAIENGVRNLCGASKTVTLSFWARSSIASKKLGVYLYQYYGSGGSPTSGEVINGTNWTLTSSWTKYTYTFTTNTLVGKTFGTNNDDYLQVSLTYMWGSTYPARVGAAGAETYVGSGNIDIAQVQLCAGDVALPFQPKSFRDELTDCQRYYETSFPYGTTPADGSNPPVYLWGFWYSTTSLRAGPTFFKVPKRTTPTIVYYGVTGGTAGKWSYLTSGGINNASATTDDYVNTIGLSVQNTTGVSTLGAGAMISGNWTASAEL